MTRMDFSAYPGQHHRGCSLDYGLRCGCRGFLKHRSHHLFLVMDDFDPAALPFMRPSLVTMSPYGGDVTNSNVIDDPLLSFPLV